jgi:hypothetical protein
LCFVRESDFPYEGISNVLLKMNFLLLENPAYHAYRQEIRQQVSQKLVAKG